jgi:RNA polymerase sigma factor (sigma-70 family)
MAESKELVEQILAGDQNSFRTLIRDHQRLVSHIVFRMIPPGPDQEDISQEVFVKVYRHLDRFRFDSKLSTWIARIAYNTCLNFLDKKKLPLYDDLAAEDDREFEPTAPEEASRPDFTFEAAQTGVILQKEIDRLPTVFKTVVTLYHLDQMSYAEIAGVMKMPVGTIKSHLFRARKMLKDRLLSKFEREEL